MAWTDVLDKWERSGGCGSYVVPNIRQESHLSEEVMSRLKQLLEENETIPISELEEKYRSFCYDPLNQLKGEIINHREEKSILFGTMVKEKSFREYIRGEYPALDDEDITDFLYSIGSPHPNDLSQLAKQVKFKPEGIVWATWSEDGEHPFDNYDQPDKRTKICIDLGLNYGSDSESHLLFIYSLQNHELKYPTIVEGGLNDRFKVSNPDWEYGLTRPWPSDLVQEKLGMDHQTVRRPEGVHENIELVAIKRPIEFL